MAHSLFGVGERLHQELRTLDSSEPGGRGWMLEPSSRNFMRKMVYETNPSSGTMIKRQNQSAEFSHILLGEIKAHQISHALRNTQTIFSVIWISSLGRCFLLYSRPSAWALYVDKLNEKISKLIAVFCDYTQTYICMCSLRKQKIRYICVKIITVCHSKRPFLRII